MNILIADDEMIVLEGLKHIIDWNTLGFSICDTATNGEETLHKILTLKPDLVLLDIRMPKMNGIEVIESAISQGYLGKFILLSGVSDFKYAQAAMRQGVDFYLTKPIDEDELTEAVSAVHERLLEESKNQYSYERYLTRAKQEIIKEILLDNCDYYNLNLEELGLKQDVFQIISYENYNQSYFSAIWNIAETLRIDDHYYDCIDQEQKKIILLKGKVPIDRFSNLIKTLQRLSHSQNSPIQSLFIACGRKVFRVEDIHLSYQDVEILSKRRFFCLENQHLVTCDDVKDNDSLNKKIPKEMAPHYAEQFSNYIQSKNQTLLTDTLKELMELLQNTSSSISSLKHFLIDIYILVKQKIMQVCQDKEISFMANAAVIELIEQKYYLYEIIDFLSEQFELWTRTVGYVSGETVIDEVFHYIQQNYQENLKLETIAPLFGYNSAYLGKILRKKSGMSFNEYIDSVRIKKSKELLADKQLRVYEVANRLGYKNVDYFHKKFKKYVGTSPAEYRKQFS